MSESPVIVFPEPVQIIGGQIGCKLQVLAGEHQTVRCYLKTENKIDSLFWVREVLTCRRSFAVELYKFRQNGTKATLLKLLRKIRVNIFQNTNILALLDYMSLANGGGVRADLCIISVGFLIKIIYSSFIPATAHTNCYRRQ